MATQTFSDNTASGAGVVGSAQNFVVPDDVTLITMECWGAQGQDQISAGHGQGGLGGYIKADVPVSPGETLQVRVGGWVSGAGSGGYNGGGAHGDASGAPGPGGGASDVRRSPYTLYDRLIVGGGGGGGAYAGVGTAGTGGGGGYPTGVAASFGNGSPQAQGGTQTAGGTRGTATGQAGTDGTFGVGGCGYRGTACGVGGGTVAAAGGGGGGGGYWGGGGGGDLAGGGGGSSAVLGGTLITHTSATRSGHGQVVFTWTPDTPVTPIEDATEWEVKVFDSTNANPFTDLLAIIPRFITIKYSRPLNDVGSGEVHILRDDPIWKATPGLLDTNENIWAFYENGELRFTMFAEDIDENHVDDQERPITKITGRDGAKLFQYAAVLPPSYPSQTQNNHFYAFCHAMQVWFFLYQEANVRGAFPTYIQSLADDSSDSAGSPYNDVSAMDVPAGQDLLSLLKQWAPVSECHWAMNPDFELVIKNTGIFGAHRGELVVFNIGNSIQGLTEKRTRRDIRSRVYIQAGDGSISEVSDSSVESQWGRRELWLQSGQSADASTGSVIANVTLAATKNEQRELTVKVRPGMTNRKVWIDYSLGDWITLEWDAEENTSTPPTQEEVQVIAISQEVDENGNTQLEVILNTRLQQNIFRLNQIVEKFTGAGGTTAANQSSVTTVGQAIGAVELNDLSDVIITSPATDSVLTWNGSNWIDQALPAPTPSGNPLSIFGDASDSNLTCVQTTSSLPSGLSKTGSGTSTTFIQSRDFWFNNLTLDASAGTFSWLTNGYRLHCQGTLTIGTGIVVHNDGPSSVATSGGASGGAGNTLGTGAAGGNGGSSTNGTAGTAVATVGLGGNGGTGGNETAGTGSAAGGVVTVAPQSPHTLANALTASMMTNTNPLAYRGGGGGGGGDGASGGVGGGGGGGGGICYVAANIMANSGTIRAQGGSGSATGAGAAGGGGGGGGGAVILVYGSGTIGTLSAPGGTGGATGGTGTNGQNGSSGTTWSIKAIY